VGDDGTWDDSGVAVPGSQLNHPLCRTARCLSTHEPRLHPGNLAGCEAISTVEDFALVEDDGMAEARSL